MTTTRDALYVVTRRDLPPGRAAAMLVHAAVNTQVLSSLPETVVLLTVADEHALLQLDHDLFERDILAWAWFEPDLDDQIAALAVISDGTGLLADLPMFLNDVDDQEHLKETRT